MSHTRQKIDVNDFDLSDSESVGTIRKTKSRRTTTVIKTTLGFRAVYQGSHMSYEGGILYLEGKPFLKNDKPIKDSGIVPLRVYKEELKPSEAPLELQELEKKYGFRFKITHATSEQNKIPVSTEKPKKTKEVEDENTIRLGTVKQFGGPVGIRTSSGLSIFYNGQEIQSERQKIPTTEELVARIKQLKLGK